MHKKVLQFYTPLIMNFSDKIDSYTVTRQTIYINCSQQIVHKILHFPQFCFQEFYISLIRDKLYLWFNQMLPSNIDIFFVKF